MSAATIILAIGLGIAALAGIPAFITNREVGDVVMVVGFAVAFGGFVLGLLAIRGQIRAFSQRNDANEERERDEQAEIDALHAQRARIGVQLQSVRDRKRDAENARGLNITMITGRDERTRGYLETIRALELEEGTLLAELEANAIQLSRHGVTV
jgi:hypothetical protein